MSSARVERLSLGQARRIALASQGFGRPKPAGQVQARHLRRLIEDVGIIQLDSVNVFCRSHYLPAFARLGPYSRELLDSMAGHSSSVTADTRPKTPKRRDLIEYWAHEASLIPPRLRPMLRWRMERAEHEAWGGIRRLAQESPELIERVYEAVVQHGPVRARHVIDEMPARRPGQMWDWHEGKVALEFLFWSGRVAAASRINFERRYDLPERVFAPEYLGDGSLDTATQQLELVRVAGRALGIATVADLADYFRMTSVETKQAVQTLLDSGELRPVEVIGWVQQAYLWHSAARPRRVQAQALLSPFDSLIWYRPRTERLFDFHYRIEIYTPAAKRKHGYYVLPFLLGEELVARVDLKSERQSGQLAVRGAFLEDRLTEKSHKSYSVGQVAEALAQTLTETAQWLGLARVTVSDNGSLAAPLAYALAANGSR